MAHCCKNINIIFIGSDEWICFQEDLAKYKWSIVLTKHSPPSSNAFIPSPLSNKACVKNRYSIYIVVPYSSVPPSSTVSYPCIAAVTWCYKSGVLLLCYTCFILLLRNVATHEIAPYSYLCLLFTVSNASKWSIIQHWMCFDLLVSWNTQEFRCMSQGRLSHHQRPESHCFRGPIDEEPGRPAALLMRKSPTALCKTSWDVFRHGERNGTAAECAMRLVRSKLLLRWDFELRQRVC